MIERIAVQGCHLLHLSSYFRPEWATAAASFFSPSFFFPRSPASCPQRAFPRLGGVQPSWWGAPATSVPYKIKRERKTRRPKSCPPQTRTTNPRLPFPGGKPPLPAPPVTSSLSGGTRSICRATSLAVIRHVTLRNAYVVAPPPSAPHRTAVLQEGVYAAPLLPSVQLGRREGSGNDRR